MTNYQNQAREFLNECSATLSINFVGRAKPIWDKKQHNLYMCILKTPRGEMLIEFYDSTHNTEISRLTLGEYIEKKYKYSATDAPYAIKARADKELKTLKAEAKPTEYDILACLITYDVGSMDDFMGDFGYEIKCVEDMTNFITTYNAVIKQYQDVKRCFTSEQIEKLSEIQ